MHSTSSWHWRGLPLEARTGSEIFAALFYQPSIAPPLSSDKAAAASIAVLLESPYPLPGDISPQAAANARYSICAGSPRVIAGQLQFWTPTLGNVFPFLRHLLQRQYQGAVPPAASALPFNGGWLGWLSYDVAWEVESLPQLNPDPLPFPVAFWYEPAEFAVLDHQEQTLWLAASTPEKLEVLTAQLAKHGAARSSIFPDSTEGDAPFASPQAGAIAAPPSGINRSTHFAWSQSDYEAAVNQAKTYIRAGEIFQANLSLRFSAST